MIEAGFNPGDEATDPEAVGLHPYSEVPPGVVRPGERVPAFPDIVLDSTLAVLDGAGFSTVPVWVTEWGVNESRRSDATVESWFTAGLRELLCRPRLGVVTIYTLSDWGGRQRYGLIGPDGRPTAAARALAAVRADFAGGSTCP